jgi:hypothetical protein
MGYCGRLRDRKVLECESNYQERESDPLKGRVFDIYNGSGLRILPARASTMPHLDTMRSVRGNESEIVDTKGVLFSSQWGGY